MREQCPKDQAAFENDFCQSRIKLHDTNEAANQCYENAQKSYASIVRESKERLNIWKHEYVAIKKILCYLDVWLHDGNSSTVKGDQIEECKKKDFDDAAMDLVFPEAPAKLVINLTLVEKYPGSPGFEQEEYSEFSGVKTISPCMTPTTTPEAHIQGPENLYVFGLCVFFCFYADHVTEWIHTGRCESITLVLEVSAWQIVRKLNLPGGTLYRVPHGNYAKS